MGMSKRFKDFRDCCLQPPQHLPSNVKRYSTPIAAVFTVTLMLSISFIAFSSILMPTQALPIVPLANTASSAVPTLLWNFTANQDTVFSPVVSNGLVCVTAENQFGSPITLLR